MAARAGPPVGGAGPAPVALHSPVTPSLSLAVGRALGTVVVSLHGEIDLDSSARLEAVLSDLIVGQGNLTVALDCQKVTVHPEALAVFVNAAGQARHHGARLVLKWPPPDALDLLESAGMADAVDLVGPYPNDAA